MKTIALLTLSFLLCTAPSQANVGDLAVYQAFTGITSVKSFGGITCTQNEQSADCTLPSPAQLDPEAVYQAMTNVFTQYAPTAYGTTMSERRAEWLTCRRSTSFSSLSATPVPYAQPISVTYSCTITRP